METRNKTKIFLKAIASSAILIVFYFLIVSLISGFPFALSQFKQYWYFLGSLALGFGVQVGLYVYLKELVKTSNMQMSGKTVAVTGTTSTLAMISCCAHYLANIIPILGIAGAFSIIAEYQVKIFWVGLIFNLFGLVFIVTRIIKFKRHI